MVTPTAMLEYLGTDPETHQAFRKLIDTITTHTMKWRNQPEKATLETLYKMIHTGCYLDKEKTNKFIISNYTALKLQGDIISPPRRGWR